MVEDLKDTIERMGRMLASSEDALGHLTCVEFQPIAEVLVAAGFDELAESVIRGHAGGDDDEDDIHHALYLAEQDDDSDPDGLAAGFVRSIKAGAPLQAWRNIYRETQAAQYNTRDARDAQAPYLAKAWKQRVVQESWSADHGWVLDGVVEYEGE